MGSNSGLRRRRELCDRNQRGSECFHSPSCSRDLKRGMSNLVADITVSGAKGQLPQTGGAARPMMEVTMKPKLTCSVLLMILLTAPAIADRKPRVFITETTAAQASGDAVVGDAKGSLAFTGGNSPQSVEVMKAFVRYCPAAVVTANREKADYVIQLDHEAINPTTPFVHGNKVAVFDRDEDLIYSNSTRILSSAVKDACAALDLRPHIGP